MYIKRKVEQLPSRCLLQDPADKNPDDDIPIWLKLRNVARIIC